MSFLVFHRNYLIPIIYHNCFFLCRKFPAVEKFPLEIFERTNEQLIISSAQLPTIIHYFKFISQLRKLFPGISRESN